jgi:hypothetical protein
MGNMLQKLSTESNPLATFEKMQITTNPISLKTLQQHELMTTKVANIYVSDSNIEIDDDKQNDAKFVQIEKVIEEEDIWSSEFENFILLKGPKQILQLILDE